MGDFCTIGDVAAFLQVSIAPDSESAARAITEASEAIRNYCHQQIDLIADDELTIDCNGGTKLFLPELPVVAVSSVVEDGDTLVEGTDYKLGQHGILHRLRGTWLRGIQIITVTYTHGRATIPDDIKAICVRAAARAYQAGLGAAALNGVSGVQAQSIGDYSVQYGAQTSGSDGMLGVSAAPILLPTEKRILDRYKV
jgi:hypothetical protein